MLRYEIIFDDATGFFLMIDHWATSANNVAGRWPRESEESAYEACESWNDLQ